ncbi:MAG: TolC family protein [Proteobacteria bacterium]|nr:TolC family protein [Pseudomonadota bacterium]
MKSTLLWMAAVSVILGTGCALTPLPQTSSLSHRTNHQAIAHAFPGDGGEPGAFSEDVFRLPGAGESIDLAGALALAMRNHPGLEASYLEIQAQEGVIMQAGLLPNPEFEVAMENFGGHAALRGVSAMELSIGLSQPIELGGKRKNRQEVATFDKTTLELDHLIYAQSLFADLAKAFVEVLATQEEAELNQELLRLAEAMLAAVAEKTDVGKVPSFEATQANLELVAARTEAENTAFRLESARQKLAGLLGEPRASFPGVIGNLDTLPESFDALQPEGLLRDNPELERAEAAVKRSSAALALAKSNAIPDITVGAGFLYARDANDYAFSIRLSIPIPVFDRNQGEIAEARAQAGKAGAEQRASQIALHTQLSEVWQTCAMAHRETQSLRRNILPLAQEAYDATAVSYREGKVNLLQYLEAQRTLFTFKRQYIAALKAFHLAAIDLQSLLGKPVQTFSSTP